MVPLYVSQGPPLLLWKDTDGLIIGDVLITWRGGGGASSQLSTWLSDGVRMRLVSKRHCLNISCLSSTFSCPLTKGAGSPQDFPWHHYWQFWVPGVSPASILTYMGQKEDPGNGTKSFFDHKVPSRSLFLLNLSVPFMYSVQKLAVLSKRIQGKFVYSVFPETETGLNT